MTTGAPLFWGRVACCIGGAADCRQERCRFRVPLQHTPIIRASNCRNDEAPAHSSSSVLVLRGAHLPPLVVVGASSLEFPHLLPVATVFLCPIVRILVVPQHQ